MGNPLKKYKLITGKGKEFARGIKGLLKASSIKKRMTDISGYPKELILSQIGNEMKKIQRDSIQQGEPLYEGEGFERAIKAEWDRNGALYKSAGIKYDDYAKVCREAIRDTSGITELTGLTKIIHSGVEKIGRNQKCPCGSGKKSKHCCGK